ncbi:MAG TPA: hypothetical protein DET40_25275 [Lentisphaeria bacterium]|nr:MAG: hypothetical protein A2X45_18690 [Lentisphaerae bacterium GWF2_50_93]HCE46873.1 hypothetical protein [Lentisphaeria bacterium]
MEKLNKFKSKKLLIILAVVLFIAVSYLSWFLILEYKVHSRECEIRNAGYPSSPEELEEWYVEPPTGQNAAMLYLEAFKKFKGRPENVDEKDMVIFGSAQIPPPGTSLSEDLLKNAKEFLLANAEALGLIHKAAALDACRFPVEIKDPERSLAYLSKLRQVAKLLQLEALVCAVEGDNAKAFEAVIDSCRIASSLDDEPLLDSFIVQMALQHMGLDNSERIIARGGLDEKQLKLLCQEIIRFEDMKPLGRAYAGERSLVLSEYYLEEFMEYAVYDFPGFVRKSPFLKKTVFFLFDVTCLRQVNNISCIGMLSELIDLANEKPENIMVGMNKIDERIKHLPCYLFAARIYMPHLCSIADKKILLVSRARVMRVAAAVEAYRMKNGKLPEDSSLLVPEYMASIPVDPLDGKTVHYKKTEKGFIAYGSGADGQDDDGNSGANNGFSKGEDFSVRIER